jgi:AraC-like DNA-binding protein
MNMLTFVNKSMFFMNKRIFILCNILLLLIVSLPLLADDMLNYEELAKLPASDLLQHGDAHMKLNHTDTAMGYYIILAGKYNTAMDKSDKYLCAMACNSAAQIFHQKDNYSKAFELYLKGVQICERNNFSDLLAEFYKNIGNLYSTFQDFQQAINCYKKGLEFARETGNTKTEIKLLMNLSGISCYADLTDEAKIYYDEMMKFAGKDTLIEYFGYLNKALILANEKKYEASIKCYEQSAAYATKMHLAPRFTGSVYGELAKLYEKIGQTDSAIHYCHLNTDYSEEHNIMYMLVESLKSLATLYEKTGDKKNALLYKSRYLAVSDSLFSMNEFNKMKNTQFIYEMDKNYQKIASLTTDKEQKDIQIKTQRKFLFIISGSLLVFIIMLILVYTHKRRLHHAYKDLFNRNNELLQSEQENKKLRIEYENKLIEERTKNAQLTITMGKAPTPEKNDKTGSLEKENEKAEETTGDSDEIKLYSANKLTEEQKENLLHAIKKVMDNPAEFCDCEFSLERLAALIGSNSRYVSLIINETYNKNFRAFINEYRIKEAQLRLMNTSQYGNYTIKAIAESVGYKSHTNFIIIFKKITGITPSIYQKIAKEKE